MELKFTLEDCVIENSEIFKGVRTNLDDAVIVIRGVKLTETKLFTDLDIPYFCSSIQNQHMDIDERTSMQSVLKKQGNKKAFIDALFQHLGSFAEGVAASIVASFIRP